MLQDRLCKNMSKMMTCKVLMIDRDGNAIDAKDYRKHISGRFESVIVGKSSGK